jgi:hypothetical protein
MVSLGNQKLTELLVSKKEKVVELETDANILLAKDK